MQISSKPVRRSRAGYALLITMGFIFVTLIIFASLMYWISSNSYVTQRNNQFNMSEAAGEAATEKVLSQMDHDFLYQSISNSGSYYATTFMPNQAGWPIGYSYSDTNGNGSNQISVYIGTQTTNTVPLNSQYSGLYGLVTPCLLTATATPINQRFNVPATISESLQFATIPLFQFAIFYNINLEIDPGATMPINGPVFSNAGIWSGKDNVTYNSTVTAVDTVYYDPTASDPYCSGKNDAGTHATQFAFTPNHSANALAMPVGTNNNPAGVEAILNLPPSTYALGTAAAFSTNGQLYLANEADLYLTNFSNGTNWGPFTPAGTNMILYYQDKANGSGAYQTKLPYDFYLLTNRGASTVFSTNFVGSSKLTNIIYAGYSFVTNVAFYDWREGWNGGSGPAKKVEAVQLDISKFNLWVTNSATNGGSTYNNQCQLSNHKSHAIWSIYVYNDVPLTGTTLPAVRVMNGTNLPSSGFTVATAMPMYVWGNYNIFGNGGTQLGQTTNTLHTYPAALMADAVTVLSTNWSDTNVAICPPAGDTTINAGCLEGIVQSTNSIYSGGVENFLRLLENWNASANPLTYNGSIVVMFPSQYATNYQVPPNLASASPPGYYTAPERDWGFDYNFTKQGGLPPLTPHSEAVIRGQWNAY